MCGFQLFCAGRFNEALGWLVLSSAALERAIEVNRRVDNGCAAVEQLT